jgi:hypothetical protein
MDQAYWLERELDAIGNARAATLADVKVIHYELAHRYSVEAAAAVRGVRGRPKVKANLSEQLTTSFPPIRAPAA